MGRDVKFRAELTGAIRANAEQLVGRVNLLIEMADLDGVAPAHDYATGSQVASGWRPLFINEQTSNAAGASKHISGQAIDLRDNAHRAFARWCLRHLDALDNLGLYMEDPQWTPTWVHLQSLPPRSGKRVYIPSTAPARIAALVEQGGTA